MNSTRLDRRFKMIVNGVVLAILIGALLLASPASPISAHPISFWADHPIAASANTVHSVALADLDNDGNLDVVSGSWAGDDMQIKAWQNNDSPYEALWLGNDVGADLGTVRSVAVGDLDNDDYLDIVSTWEYDDGDPATPDYKVIIWKNDGTPFLGEWASYEVALPELRAHSVALGDLDDNGYLDIVVGLYHNSEPVDEKGILDLSKAPVRRIDLDRATGEPEEVVIVWENPGPADPFANPWTEQTVGEGIGDVNTVAVGDLDNDEDLDIVTGSGWAEDYEVIAWRNDGSPFSGELWLQNDVGAATSVWSVALGDLNNDDYLDIVSGSVVDADYEVIAWRNDGSPFAGYWTGNNVGASLDTVWSVAVGDLDNDGDRDIVSGSGDAEVDEVIAWENDGSPFSGTWDRHSVGAITAGAWSVALGHLDDEGYLDIVAGIGYPHDYEVMAWRNKFYAVEVTPATDAKSGDPGQTVTYTLQVTNNGCENDAFDVEVSGNAWTTSAAVPAVGPLAAGASANVDVTVDIPADATAGTTDVATVTVTSWADDTQSDTSELTTTVNDVGAIKTTPATDAKSGNPGQTVTYTLQVTNNGNTTDTFDVAVSGNVWTTSAPSTVGPLAAGASANMDVTVTIPTSAAGGATDVATVTVTSQIDNTQWDASILTTTAIHLANGSFELGPRIPAPWKGHKLTTKDRRVCKTAYDGSCSFKMLGSTANKSLRQVVKISGSAGDTFKLQGWSKAKNPLPKGGAYCLVAKVFHTDGTKSTYKRCFAKKTHDWQRRMKTFTVAKDYKKIVVFLLFDKQSGRAWFDDVRLIKK